MLSGRVEAIQTAIAALVDQPVVGPFGDDIRELLRLRSRLDSQIARRVAAFDTSGEWAIDGSRGAAGWIARECRMTHAAAHSQVHLARETREMPLVTAAWEEGRTTTAHVQRLATARRAADADDAFKELEEAFLA